MRLELLGVRFELVFIKPERMFGAALLGEPGLRIRVTDRERTVVDMLDRSDLCGGVPAAAAALEEAWPELDGSASPATSSASPAARCRGVSGTSSSASACCRRTIRCCGAGARSSAPATPLLERGGPAEGPFVRRWRLRVNVPGLRRLRRVRRGLPALRPASPSQRLTRLVDGPRVNNVH